MMRREVSPAARGVARLQVLVFRAVTAVVDAGSPAVRFGVGHAVRRRLLQRSLSTLTDGPGAGAEASDRQMPLERQSTRPLVALVTRTLGTGGVEAIVATLAQGLPAQGLDCVVLCERGGSTADVLRARGVVVVEAHDLASASSALAGVGQVMAAQLHNAPDHLIAACVERHIPIVPVIHTTDINLIAADWEKQADLFERSAAVIAVSETVRAFSEHALPHSSQRVTVVPNGVAVRESGGSGFARTRLGDALGVEIGETTVIACLARYDIQKNIPGLVSAFLDLAADHDALLVVAGPVEDWLEYAHADAIRRAHPLSARVHLLGSSSSSQILDAADVFVLDSFFEGWPVAASEAAMAGVPLVLSDVGGALELTGDGRGLLCRNPAADPSAITLAEIRGARRRSTQSNRAELAAALGAICDEIPEWRARREQLAAAASVWLGAGTMVARHASLLQEVGVAAQPSLGTPRENHR